MSKIAGAVEYLFKRSFMERPGLSRNFMLKSFFSSLVGRAGSGPSDIGDTNKKDNSRKGREHSINNDPEDENFPELRNTSDSSSDFELESGGKEKMHYKGATDNASSSHKKNFLLQSKYSGGTISSRKELGLDLELMSARPTIDLDGFGGFSDSKSGSDFNIGSDDNFNSDNDDDYNSGSASDQGNSNNKDDMSSMISRIKKNLSIEKKEEEENEIMLISQKQEEQALKGMAVKHDLEEYQRLIGLRIDLQPLIQLSNAIPYPPERIIMPLALKDKSFKNELGKLLKGTMSVSSDFIALFESICCSKTKSVLGLSEPEEMEKALSFLDSSMTEEWRTSLDDWHQKVHLGDSFSSKKMKIINQGIFAQLEMATRDMSRLLKRTKVQRPTSLKRNLPSSFYEDAGEQYFDDQDFYNVLCRDWIDSRVDGSSTSTSSSSSYSIKPLSNAGEKQAETKASKGRKIRYDTHAKLVNYMIPRSSSLEWGEEKINSFFASVFPVA